MMQILTAQRAYEANAKVFATKLQRFEGCLGYCTHRANRYYPVAGSPSGFADP
jgi:hypothetical protein